MSLQRPERSEATVPEVKELHAKMGQLAMENDFLAGRSVAWALLDWRTRRVLTWRLSNSLSTDFCIEAVEEAVQCHGKPTIVNTDQGRQFTRREFVSLIQGHGIRVSMDGKGRSLDNVFVERLWKSLKYEEVY